MIDVNFRGNIYIVQNGKVLYERETGFADLSNEIPNTAETKFASASAGKVFVAVGILKLIERGKIKFDDTLTLSVKRLCPSTLVVSILLYQLREHIFCLFFDVNKIYVQPTACKQIGICDLVKLFQITQIH